MILITPIKFKKRARDVGVGKKLIQHLLSSVKMIGTYWTLRMYDAVWAYEGTNEKDPKSSSMLVMWQGQRQCCYIKGRSNEASLRLKI